MHSEVDASHSHQQYDPNRHRQNRDLMPGSLKMPAHKNGYGQIEGCGRQRVAAGIGQARNLDELCNCLRARPVNVVYHHTHPATANLAEDTVMGNRLPHELGGCGHWLDMLGGDEG